MLFANIGSAPNNNYKQIHTIGLSDPKTVIVYYNLTVIVYYNLKSVTDFVGDWFHHNHNNYFL